MPSSQQKAAATGLVSALKLSPVIHNAISSGLSSWTQRTAWLTGKGTLSLVGLT